MRYISLLALSAALLLAACGQQAPATGGTASSGGTVASSAVGLSIEEGLRALETTQLTAIETAIDQNDVAAAKTGVEAFDEGWDAVEDGVKDASPEAYEAIEGAMETMEDAIVRADTLNAADAKAATAEVRKQIDDFIATLR